MFQKLNPGMSRVYDYAIIIAKGRYLHALEPTVDLHYRISKTVFLSLLSHKSECNEEAFMSKKAIMFLLGVAVRNNCTSELKKPYYTC